MYNEHILLIEDDPLAAKTMAAILTDMGLHVERAGSAEAALSALDESAFDLILADINLPGMSGVELQGRIARDYPDVPVLLITGHGNIAQAVEAIKNGAFDYLLKTGDFDAMEIAVRRAIETVRLRRENRALRRAAADNAGDFRMIGRAPGMRELFKRIDRVAVSDSTVLLMSETGTGKELVARAIHARSRRARGPFVACNCAAFNPLLLESELFGHEKGAFTGAHAMRSGRFEEADGGTLFLDEIGETSRDFQAKLLRVLQEKEIERVGSSKKISVDVRIIASTNRNLERETAEGRFREDLFYRLSVVPIVIPPLRERREDIPELARYFAEQFAEQYGRVRPLLTPDAEAYLMEQEWPGNVRELRNAIERAVVLADGDVLTRDDFERNRIALPAGDAAEPASLSDARDDAARRHIVRVLDQCGWERKKAAEQLGIDRVTLYRLLRRHQITQPESEAV